MRVEFARLKHLFLLLCFVSSAALGQRLSKSDKNIMENLKTSVTYLASDQLEGRRTGTPGEKLAYQYLSNEFSLINLIPKGDNGTYLQAFEIHEGKEILPSTQLKINSVSLEINKEFFPLNFSSNGEINASASPSLQENKVPWFFDIKELLVENANNPHFDIMEALKNKCEEFVGKGATAVIIYNSGSLDDGLSFDTKSKISSINIPIIYLTKEAEKKYLSEKNADYKLHLRVEVGEKKRTGHNVIGYIDNHAANTIVIGAHFDHLGYGEDHNSLWTGKPEIHNGADDNASGTAVVLEMARILQKSKLKNNNYLFICFSGEELGLFGSKSFTENPTIPLDKINYMINLDMVGRLNESTHGLTIGGYGTSPTWGTILPEKTKTISVKFDSSGIGPSDHTSFYLKNIPVLFFFTGSHPDYHKPTDDVDKINFHGELLIIKYIENILEQTNKIEKLPFSKTKEPNMGTGVRFTVSLGVMPDYTYSETGVRIDGIISGRIAEKAGLLAGDVIIQLGDYKVTGVEDYMTALSHFKKGDATSVKIKRVKEEKTFDIVF
jgi:hypothetical protein